MVFLNNLDSEQFWLLLWAGIAATFFALASIFFYTEYKEDLILKELVEKGHDPIEIMCLYKPTFNKEVCILLSQQRSQK